jgi:hypothetical protein
MMQGGQCFRRFQVSFEPSYAEVARLNYPPDAQPKRLWLVCFVLLMMGGL